jgi:hypothetical protein
MPLFVRRRGHSNHTDMQCAVPLVYPAYGYRGMVTNMRRSASSDVLPNIDLTQFY